VKQPSDTVTTSSPTGGNVVPGTSVSDSATVTGIAGGPTPTGTVKFFLCQPAEVTAAGCPAGAGTQIGTPPEGETLNASGVAQSESTSNTLTIGTYCWRAEYSGDGFYLASAHTNATTECFTTVAPGEGCTPGFWSGGVGADMWNTFPSDPDWTANGATGTNPFGHSTLFNDFFTPHSSLNGKTMIQVVGTGGGSNLVQKTARMLIAAYLNSAAGLSNGFTTDQLKAMWTAFVTGGATDTTLFNTLAASNELGCPFPR
jgi:hypothetical protein